MNLTPRSKQLALYTSLLSVVFFLTLEWAVENEEWTWLVVAAVSFGLLIAVAGALLGRKDPSREYRGDLSLVYHTVAVTVVGLWSLALMPFLDTLHWGSVGLYAVIALFGWLPHYLSSRQSVKGHEKKEIFE